MVSHGWTIRRAAEEFGVPRSTLYDRVCGRVMFGARSGPTRYLNDQEEKELCFFLPGVPGLVLLEPASKSLQL